MLQRSQLHLYIVQHAIAAEAVGEGANDAPQAP